MPMQSHRKRFAKAVERLAGEVSILMADQAALEALLETNPPTLMRVCFQGLMGDRLARLIRILEVSKRNEVASFWYLLQCEPKRVKFLPHEKARLERLAGRLKPIRDQTFFHIDKEGVLDRAAIYATAGITGDEIAEAIKILWKILKTLYAEEFSGRTPPSWLTQTHAGLREIFARDLSVMGLKRG